MAEALNQPNCDEPLLTRHLPRRPWSAQAIEFSEEEYDAALNDKLRGAERWRRSRELLPGEAEIFDSLSEEIVRRGEETDRAVDSLMYLALIVDERLDRSK